MSTRKEKLIEELAARSGGNIWRAGEDARLLVGTSDYDTDELHRKLDMIDEKPQVDKMTPAEFRRQYEQRFESDSHAATALRYASTGYRKYNKEWESMLMPRGDYELDGDITTGASSEPDDNTMSFDELIDHMRNVRDMFMAGNASIPQRCGGHLPPSDELLMVGEYHHQTMKAFSHVQMLGGRNYTWRMTRGKQPRKIKVWHKPPVVTINCNGE